MKRHFATLIALAFVALAARLAAGALLHLDGEVKDATVVTASGFEIATSVYEPRERKHAGAVVLCHGISASRAHMDPMARTLARRGHLVVSFDYGGHGRSQNRPGLEEHNVADVLAGVALARRSGAGDGPIGLVGHSMGVTSAAAASLRDPGVVCVVALGQRPFVTRERPRALLLADGTQDMFHPYANLRSVAAEAAGQPVHALDTVVDPDTGAVRRLFLSGSCEHAGEVYDGAILGELATFLESALGAGGAPPPASYEVRAPLAVSLRFVSNVAATLALIVLGLLLGERLGLAREPAGEDSLPPAPDPRVVRRKVACALALAPVVFLGLARALASPALGELAVSLLLGVLVCGALLARRASGEPVAWRPVLAVGGVLFAGWIGGTALGAAPAFWDRPELLKGLPLYVWQGVAFRFEFSTDALAARLAVGNTWPTILGLLAVLAVEAAWPGRFILIVAGFLKRLVDALGGRFGKPRAEAPAPSRKRTLLAVAALVLLLVVAGALFAKRAKEGLLAEEGALSTVASAGLRMLLLPIAAAAAALWLGRGVRRLRELVAGAQQDESLAGGVGQREEEPDRDDGQAAAVAVAVGKREQEPASATDDPHGGEDEHPRARPGSTPQQAEAQDEAGGHAHEAADAQDE